jgi:hydroxymethylbilane synthase
MKIRVGSRGSALARYQTGLVIAQLRSAGHEVELEIIRTEGDRDQRTPFAQIGAPGLFVRALEDALLDRRVDLAVHSYKDLPSDSPEGLLVGAVPKREDPTDALLTTGASPTDPEAPLGLRRGARVGTASARREAWLKHLDPGLQVGHLRGNLPRRIQQLVDGHHDAILLASAGLSRLQESGVDLSAVRIQPLSPEVFIPAPTQGALALQVRVEDAALQGALAGTCSDSETMRCVGAERALLRLVEGGCLVPFGALCQRVADGQYALHAAMVRGESWFEGRATGPSPDGLAEEIWSTWKTKES